MVMWFAWVIWEEFFSQENTPEGHTETHKSSFVPYKQVSGRNDDHEWLRMTNAFILCDLVWKVQKRHAVNREDSFKWIGHPYCITCACFAHIHVTNLWHFIPESSKTIHRLLHYKLTSWITDTLRTTQTWGFWPHNSLFRGCVQLLHWQWAIVTMVNEPSAIYPLFTCPLWRNCEGQ